MKQLLFIFSIICVNVYSKTIRVLSWWDYHDPSTVKVEEVKFTEYRTTDLALSKALMDKKYDVYIIPEWVAEVLTENGLIDNSTLKELIAERQYITELKSSKVQCLPYMWGVTTFMSKGSVTSLKDIVKAKKKGRSIKLIDDKVEFLDRFFEDYNFVSCINNKSSSDLCRKRVIKDLKNFEKQDFQSTVESKDDFYSLYGWHGELSLLMSKSKDYKFYIPSSRPAIGADYICMSSRTEIDSKRVFKFIKEFSNKKSSEKHSLKTMYFSPYLKHEIPLIPENIKKLRDITEEKIKTGNYKTIGRELRLKLKRVNSFWKMVRY